MTDIVERLREYAEDDHERGCAGRCYDCSCGYDSKRDPLLNEAARTIEILRVELTRINMENDRLTRTNRAKREHRDKLLQTTAKQSAEIEKLRTALREIVDLGGAHGSAAYAERADKIARAALEGGR